MLINARRNKTITSPLPRDFRWSILPRVKTMLLRMNVWRSLRGLPRDLWVLSAATLINRLGMMAIPFLVLYLTRELEWSAPRAGLALGVYGAGSIIAAPVAGRLCDRIGGLPIIRASLLG